MPARPTNVRWLVLTGLAAASFVSYALRSNLSLAAPAMIRDLQLNEIQWGWIQAAFLTGYTIFQFPGGIYGDKAGPRQALAVIAGLWSILMLLTVAVPGPDVASLGVIIASLIGIRFLTGVVHAPIFPVVNAAISRWFPVGGWAFPTGLTSSGLTLGTAAAAPVLAWLVTAFGWRSAFLILAPLGFIVAAFWWRIARDYPDQHPATNAAEVALITAERPAPVLSPVNPPGWVRVLKNRDILLLTASYACSNFIFYSVFSWFFYYLVEIRTFEASVAGFATSTQWIAGAAGAAFGGWLCDRLCRRIGLRWGGRWPVIIGNVGCAVLLVIGAWHGDPLIAVTFLATCFLFQQTTEGAYWSTSISIGNQLAGAAGGVMNTGANAMGVANAMLVPWFAQQFGWPFAIASGAIFALLAVLLLLFVRADRPILLD